MPRTWTAAALAACALGFGCPEPAAAPEPTPPTPDVGDSSMDYDAQVQKIRTLRDDPHTDSAAALLVLAAEPTPSRVREEAADALWSKVSGGMIEGWLTPASAALRESLESGGLDGLAGLLEDDNAEVRLAAVKILGQLRGERVQGLLRAASTGDASEEVRAKAAEQL